MTAAVTSSSTRSGPAPAGPPDPTCTVRLRRIGRLNGPVRIVEATSLVGESTETARHAAQAWLAKKQADR